MIGGNEPGGPAGLGGLDCGHQCFRRGGRLGHPRGRETGPVPTGGGVAGFRLRPVGVILAMSSFAVPLKKKKKEKKNP